jgi:hypothetical protein
VECRLSNSVNVTEIERVYYSAMVVLQRTELGRMRLLFLLTIVLATTALVASVTLYSQAGENMRLALAALGAVGLLALALALLQLFVYPKRSHALLVQRGSEMIIATNSLHEGFKLRFLRDVLSENVTSLSDEERARWKSLESDGYYPALCVKSPRKVLILRLCTMIFDDVFAVDASNRWEHHNSASTAEPSFAKGERPRLKTWKELDAGSGPS